MKDNNLLQEAKNAYRQAGLVAEKAWLVAAKSGYRADLFQLAQEATTALERAEKTMEANR